MPPIDPGMSMRPVRNCDGCTFCCRSMPIEPPEHAEAELKPLLPFMIRIGWITRRDVRRAIPDFFKPGDCDCPHQRNGHGCAIYDRRPLGCRLWSCMWALGRLGPEFDRPDTAGYALDPNTIEYTFSKQTFECVMFWCDWTRIDELKADPKLRSLMQTAALRGHPSILRAGDVGGGSKSILIFPPPLADWTEHCNPEWMSREEIKEHVQTGNR